MRKLFFLIFVFVGYAIPAFAFFQRSSLGFGITTICLGIAWMVFYQMRWFQYNPIGLVFGIMSNVYSGWVLPLLGLQVISGISALSAWDLAHYEKRLQLASPDDSILRLSQRHFLHLFVFIFAASLVSFGTLKLRVTIDFWSAIILLVIIFIGLIQLVKKLLSVGE